MKVIAYARYSSSGQDPESITRQHDAAKALADRKGWVISEWLKDEAKSAFHGHNKRFGALGKIIKRVEVGDIGQGDVLIVEAVDRLSRQDVWDALTTFMSMMNAGVTVATTSNDQVLNRTNYKERWTDIIALLATMAEAHQGSARKQGLGNHAWEKRRAAGVLTLMNPAWLNKDGEPRPERVALVKEAFALALDGYGVNKIAKVFNDRGERSWGGEKRSGVWSSSYISRLLRNRAVIGEFQPRTGPDSEPAGPAVPDYFKRIIDQETFDRVNAKVSQRKFAGAGSGRKGVEWPNLFRSMMVCEKCEASMILLHTGKYPYLKCAGGRVGSCDHVQGYHYETLERAFIKFVIELKIDVAGQSAGFAIKSEIATLTNDIDTLDRNINFIIKKMLTLDSPALDAQLTAFEKEKAAKVLELADAQRRLILEASPLDAAQRQVAELYAALYEREGDKTIIRMRIHDKLTEMVKAMAMTPNGNLWFILRDETFYFLNRVRPEGLRIKGKFPLDRYEWRGVSMTEAGDTRYAA